MKQYQTALVTGASSGIGAETAFLLGQQGLRVALAARREARLREVAERIIRAGGQAEIFPVDLSQEGQAEALYRRVTASFGRLDVLVNNAGFGYYGYFMDMSLETVHQMLMVDGEAVLVLTSLALRDMVARGRGHVIQIGSMAADLPSQGNALYAGVKGLLDTWHTALYREMRGTGVHVSLVRPGPVQTEFFAVSSNQDNALPNPAMGRGVSAERVARRVLRLLSHPRKRVHVPPAAAGYRLLEWTTGWLQDLIGPVDLKRYRQLK